MASTSENFNKWLKNEKIDINSCNIREKTFLPRIFNRIQRNVDLTNKQKEVLNNINSKPVSNDKKDELTFISFLEPLKGACGIKPYFWKKDMWMELNGRKLNYYLVDGHVCFSLNEVAEFINSPFGTVKKAYDRAKKKYFLRISDDIFIEGKDYLEFHKDDFIVRDESYIDNNGGKIIIFVTYLGLWKLLISFRDEYPTWVYYKLAEKEYNRTLHFTRECLSVPFNIGTKLNDLYKKYGKFLETLEKIESAIERWFYIYAWDKINGLESQYKIGYLHVDFAIPSIKLAIECDGRASHKTVEQIDRDNKRDAFLNSEGWQVQRFTGHQIYNDVEGCVFRVLKIIKAKLDNIE